MDDAVREEAVRLGWRCDWPPNDDAPDDQTPFYKRPPDNEYGEFDQEFEPEPAEAPMDIPLSLNELEQAASERTRARR